MIESKFRKLKHEPAFVPTWIMYDKKVLKFQSYFTETVGEQQVIHHCDINFYLEDGTMRIMEPSIDNSGIPQG